MHLGFVQYFYQIFYDFDLVYNFKTYKTNIVYTWKPKDEYIVYPQIIHVIYNITTCDSSNL
jgi:hypothetical protein